MNRRIIICLLFLCSMISLCAETRVVLRSTEEITGTIVFQNEEVIVIKDADGKRYQYPMSEIVRIEEVETIVEEKPQIEPKKVGIVIGLNGGIACEEPIGGIVGGNMMLGANNLLNKQIFFGGSIGYNALILNKVNYSLLPIQIYTAIPIPISPEKELTRHAPFVGVGIGYGVALAQSYQGGLNAAFDFGWRVKINQQSAFMLSARVDFQQLTTFWSDNTYSEVFENKTTHTLCGLSLRTAILF